MQTKTAQAEPNNSQTTPPVRLDAGRGGPEHCPMRMLLVLGGVVVGTACGKGAEPSGKPSAQGESETTSPPSTPSAPSRLAYAAQLKVTRGDRRPYADVDYVFCLSKEPRRLDYIKATIANQSADWLVAILYSPELRRTKVSAGQTTSSRFVSSLRIAVHRRERISNSEITIKPGESRKVVYWFNPDAEMQGDVERTIRAPNPPDSSVYTKEGLLEWLILPGDDDDADPRYPVPQGIRVGSPPLRITDFQSAPTSACDVTEKGPYEKPDKGAAAIQQQGSGKDPWLDAPRVGPTPVTTSTGSASSKPAPKDSTVVVAKPTRVTASSSHKADPTYTFTPNNMTDGDLKSSWQPASAARPTWVRLDFPREITVTSIGIANGFQTTDQLGDEFMLNSRIAKGRARFSDNSEIKIEFEQDARGFVRFDVPQKGTRSVTIFVDDVFRGTKWNDLAVSEVEVRASKP